MSDFKVNIDISSLTQYLDGFAKELAKDLQKGIEGLAKSTHAHIKEDAQNGLHSFREKYLENLSPPEQINDYLWVITLNSPAVWIEEGKPEWDMKGVAGEWGLLKKPTGRTKDGRAYKIIPMNQAKSASQFTESKGAYEKAMVETVKAELRSRKIPYKKLEIDPRTGSPRIGKLHAFDIPSNIPGKGNTPQLHGLTIYQQMNPKTKKVERRITTFRTAVEGDGKWMHPEAEAKGFFEKARVFAEQEWETKWMPAIMQKYSGR